MKAVRIVKQVGSSPIDFAVSDIEAVLREIGCATEVLQPGQTAELAEGTSIVIAAAQESPWVDEVLSGQGIELPELEPEGYTIQLQGSDGQRLIAVVGHDQRGTMYGGLELAEQLMLQGSLQAIHGKTEKPFLAFRSVDQPALLKGRYQSPDPYGEPESYERIQKVHYWKLYFDQMARNRYNTVILMPPFDYMIVNEKYPEAAGIPEDQLNQNIQLFRTVIAMAKARAIDVYFMPWWDGWNIQYSPEFAEAHGIYQPPLPEGQRPPIVDTPLMRDYTREKIKSLLKTYPELTGIACAAGERMPGIARRPLPNPGTRGGGEAFPKDLWYNAQWIKDTWVAAVEQSGRTVPFMLRAWNTRPEIAQNVIAADYPGPMYIALKFNGEHTYSSPRPHCYNEAWLNQRPKNYELVWELSIQSDVTNFRWGDPQFVKELVRNAAVDGVGLRAPSAERTYGRRRVNPHTDMYAHHVTWDFPFQKHWFADKLWGRLSYNPETPDEVWARHFVKRFGEGGESAYQALMHSSKVLPTTTCFHWNYMNHDWQPEVCVGGGNSPLRALWFKGGGVGNYREWVSSVAPKKFHSVSEWIFNFTIEKKWLTIRQYVNRVAAGQEIADEEITPLEVADMLEENANLALEHIEQASPGIAKGEKEFECVALDVKAVAKLGKYYAEKTRGAVELMFFLRTGDESHQAKSIEHLEKAALWWNELSLVTSSHYEFGYALGWKAKWENYRRDVERDIRIPRQLGYHECPIW